MVKISEIHILDPPDKIGMFCQLSYRADRNFNNTFYQRTEDGMLKFITITILQ